MSTTHHGTCFMFAMGIDARVSLACCRKQVFDVVREQTGTQATTSFCRVCSTNYMGRTDTTDSLSSEECHAATTTNKAEEKRCNSTFVQMVKTLSPNCSKKSLTVSSREQAQETAWSAEVLLHG